MDFYKPEDIINKINSALARALRVSIGAVEGLPESTKMSKFLGTNTLEYAIYDAAGFMAENPQTRPIGDAITHYGNSNSTLRAFYQSIIEAMKNVPIPEKRVPLSDRDVKRQEETLRLAAQKRQFGKLSNGVYRGTSR